MHDLSNYIYDYNEEKDILFGDRNTVNKFTRNIGNIKFHRTSLPYRIRKQNGTTPTGILAEELRNHCIDQGSRFIYVQINKNCDDTLSLMNDGKYLDKFLRNALHKKVIVDQTEQILKGKIKNRIDRSKPVNPQIKDIIFHTPGQRNEFDEYFPGNIYYRSELEKMKKIYHAEDTNNNENKKMELINKFLIKCKNNNRRFLIHCNEFPDYTIWEERKKQNVVTLIRHAMISYDKQPYQPPAQDPHQLHHHHQQQQQQQPSLQAQPLSPARILPLKLPRPPSQLPSHPGKPPFQPPAEQQHHQQQQQQRTATQQPLLSRDSSQLPSHPGMPPLQPPAQQTHQQRQRTATQQPLLSRDSSNYIYDYNEELDILFGNGRTNQICANNLGNIKFNEICAPYRVRKQSMPDSTQVKDLLEELKNHCIKQGSRFIYVEINKNGDDSLFLMNHGEYLEKFLRNALLVHKRIIIQQTDKILNGIINHRIDELQPIHPQLIDILCVPKGVNDFDEYFPGNIYYRNELEKLKILYQTEDDKKKRNYMVRNFVNRLKRENRRFLMHCNEFEDCTVWMERGRQTVMNAIKWTSMGRNKKYIPPISRSPLPTTQPPHIQPQPATKQPNSNRDILDGILNTDVETQPVDNDREMKRLRLSNMNVNNLLPSTKTTTLSVSLSSKPMPTPTPIQQLLFPPVPPPTQLPITTPLELPTTTTATPLGLPTHNDISPSIQTPTSTSTPTLQSFLPPSSSAPMSTSIPTRTEQLPPKILELNNPLPTTKTTRTPLPSTPTASPPPIAVATKKPISTPTQQSFLPTTTKLQQLQPPPPAIRDRIVSSVETKHVPEIISSRPIETRRELEGNFDKALITMSPPRPSSSSFVAKADLNQRKTSSSLHSSSPNTAAPPPPPPRYGSAAAAHSNNHIFLVGEGDDGIERVELVRSSFSAGTVSQNECAIIKRRRKTKTTQTPPAKRQCITTTTTTTTTTTPAEAPQLVLSNNDAPSSFALDDDESRTERTTDDKTNARRRSPARIVAAKAGVPAAYATPTAAASHRASHHTLPGSSSNNNNNNNTSNNNDNNNIDDDNMQEERQEALTRLTDWLMKVIGGQPIRGEMSIYARRLLELGFHSSDIIREYCTEDDIQSFQSWMKDIHRRIFLAKYKKPM